METSLQRTCPGCGLTLPHSEEAVYEGYYLTSPECWGVFTEVIGEEFGNAVLFGQVHQLTVDAYAVQHAGGPHPKKSIGIHLAGLFLVLERGIAPPDVARRLQRLAAAIAVWPQYAPPEERGALTVWDVALADSPLVHAERARAWAEAVWASWSEHHAAVAALVAQHLV